jgi:hypothetical protein
MKKGGTKGLERFPAWAKCRELNKAVYSVGKKAESERFVFRQYSMSGNMDELMAGSAELSEAADERDTAMITKRLNTNCVRLKSAIYSVFDCGMISKEDFLSVLFPLNAFVREIKKIREQVVKIGEKKFLTKDKKEKTDQPVKPDAGLSR